LGEKIFDHMVVVFTNCEGDNYEELKKKMETEFKATIKKSLLRDIPMVFTKKDSEQGLDELKKIVSSLDMYDSSFFAELRKIQEDEDKTKLDEERFVEKQFSQALYSNLCEIL
jgi:selenocysteine-specific translation elongation factor